MGPRTGLDFFWEKLLASVGNGEKHSSVVSVMYSAISTA